MYKLIRTLIHYIYLHFALASWNRCQTLLPLSNGMVCPRIVRRVAASEVKDVMLAISETRFKMLVNTISTSSRETKVDHWADGFIESNGGGVMSCSGLNARFFRWWFLEQTTFTEEGLHLIQKKLGAWKPMCVFEQGVLTQQLAVFHN